MLNVNLQIIKKNPESRLLGTPDFQRTKVNVL
jgi:hypothetical protein